MRGTASRACTIAATRVATSGRLISSAVKFGICGLLGWRRRSVQAQKPDASKLAISNARANVTRSARRALRKRIGGDDECAGPAALRGLRKLRRSSPSAVAFTTYVRSPSVHERQRDRRTADQRDELAAFTRSPRRRGRVGCIRAKSAQHWATRRAALTTNGRSRRKRLSRVSVVVMSRRVKTLLRFLDH